MKTIPQDRFERTRAAVLVAREKRDAYHNALGIKYGSSHTVHDSWLTAAERRRRAQLDAAYDRAADRMHKLLEASPRDWRAGVPTYWACEVLTYADATRPRDEPLSVVPPCAYGYSRPVC